MSAEAAVVLPVLLLVLAMAVWVLACVGAQLRSTDAASAAARLAARGQSVGEVQALGARVAPRGADVAVRVGPEQVEVTVRAAVRPFGGVLSRLPTVHVTGRAVAAREDVPDGQP